MMLLLFFLQLIYEFQQILGEPIRDKFEKKLAHHLWEIWWR